MKDENKLRLFSLAILVFTTLLSIYLYNEGYFYMIYYSIILIGICIFLIVETGIVLGKILSKITVVVEK